MLGVRQSAAARRDLIVRVLHASSDWWGLLGLEA